MDKDNVARQRLIHQGVRRWNQWRKANSKEPLDFREADLSGLNLVGVDLRGADLSRANLSRANLKGALLRSANLTEANLNEANLTQADLNAALMARASLKNANLFKADLSRADLTQADLSDVEAEEAYLIEAQVSRATLISANLSKTILTNAIFEQSNLSNANLNKADLSFANFSKANLTQANLSKIIFLEGLVCDANLANVNLYCANCQQTSFKGSSLLKANLNGGNFCGAFFMDADLSGASLKESKFDDANFKEAHLDSVQLGEKSTIMLAPPTAEDQVVQRPLPATEFMERSSASANGEANGIGHVTQSALLEPQGNAPIQSLVDTSTLIHLHFSESVDWIAFAIALKQVNRAYADPILQVVKLEVGPEGFSAGVKCTSTENTELIKEQMMQYYESLQAVLTQTLRPVTDVKPQTPKSQANGQQVADFAPQDGDLNQLLNLLAANLFYNKIL